MRVPGWAVCSGGKRGGVWGAAGVVKAGVALAAGGVGNAGGAVAAGVATEGEGTGGVGIGGAGMVGGVGGATVVETPGGKLGSVGGGTGAVESASGTAGVGGNAGIDGGAATGGMTVVAGDASSWQYLLTQAGAIVQYLRLSLLPMGQVFDYGTRLVTGPGAVGTIRNDDTSVVIGGATSFETNSGQTTLSVPLTVTGAAAATARPSAAVAAASL